PNVINSNVTLGAAQNWTINTGATLTVNGVINDLGGGPSFTKTGGGTPPPPNPNTYTPRPPASRRFFPPDRRRSRTPPPNTPANTLKTTFSTGPVSVTAGTLQLRANGNNDSSAQLLIYGNQLQAASSNSTYTVDVDQQSPTGGTNKTFVMGNNNVGAGVTMNV